jgi:hypothetical protein
MKAKKSWRNHQLLTATLVVGALAAPAIANSTRAGTQITNEATASYRDPNNPTQTLKTTSNIVEVTVAEVAGITATPFATVDTNGGTVLPNDIINFDFKVTNVGNDSSGITLPGAAVINGPGTLSTGATPAAQYAYSTDGGTTWIAIPAGGTTVPNVAPGAEILVRVPVQVTTLASSGAPITVQLGDAGGNDNSAGTQNQASSGAANDIRTKDNLDNSTPGEVTGTPSNGEREAAAIQTLLVGSQPQTFATVLKSNTHANGPTTALNDDEITYNLGLRVESIAPTGSTSLSPAALTGIKLTGLDAAKLYVLVSDAVPGREDAPQQTTYIAGSAASTNAQWVPVFTSDPLTIPATAATWSTAAPANPTRVGFIYDATNAALPVGTIVNGISFKVQTSGVTGTATIANIAQLFGQTNGNTGPDKPLVYDESGDQSPSNFNENGTPGPSSTTLTPNTPPAQVPTGKADPDVNNVDNTNDNKGVGPGGEDNVITLAAPGTLLNGPANSAPAVGPTNNNDDFTNKSADIANFLPPGSLLNPPAVSFVNTISNPAPIDPNNPRTGELTGILLVPDTANFVPAAGEQLPPTGTTVTLTYGGQTAVYTFNGTNFVFSSGSPIIVPTLAPGATVSYGVSVDLPDGTPLSTDTAKGFSIPLYAFKDENGDGRPNPTENTQNRTIDRVYTGFLKLNKEARILDPAGLPVAGPAGQWFVTPPVGTTDLKPGNQIEYRITYKNISIAPTGAGNLTLSATDIAVTEDGTVAPSTWAKDQDTNGVIDTSHVMNSVTATYGSTQYFPSGEQSGATAPADVTKYVHTPGVPIQPQADGTFIFRRQIN